MALQPNNCCVSVPTWIRLQAVSMIELETKQTVPLTAGEDGVIRITGSRVTLDSIVSQFKRGATADWSVSIWSHRAAWRLRGPCLY